jgi:hypothetical protein
LYSELRERIARDHQKSAAIRRIDPKKLNVIELYLASRLWGGRSATREEIDSVAAEDFDRAIEQAFAEFPSWATPDKTAATPRATAEERLDSANAALARKATAPKPNTSPAAKRERLARLPADVRLAIANGSTLFGFNEND